VRNKRRVQQTDKTNILLTRRRVGAHEYIKKPSLRTCLAFSIQ
jgi:hypothetical protein